MLSKLRALLVGTVALAGMLVVSAPAAQAANYTAVAQTHSYGRTVILWRLYDGNRICFHAEGKNMLSGEQVGVVKNSSEVRSATAPHDGANVSSASLCGWGSTYHAYLDMRAPDLFAYAGPWTE